MTERTEVEGEEVWRCTAPDCTRRTYGTSDIDFEATAELTAQDGPEDEADQDDDAGHAPPLTAPVCRSPRGRVSVHRYELNIGAAAVTHLIGQITF